MWYPQKNPKPTAAGSVARTDSCPAAIGPQSSCVSRDLQRSQGRDSLIPWTLTRNLAVFKDQLAGVGAPHTQLVKLLGSTKARHTLDRKPKEALVRFAPLGA